MLKRMILLAILLFPAYTLYADDSTDFVTEFDCDMLYREHLTYLTYNDYVSYLPYYGVFRQFDNTNTQTSVLLGVGIYPDYETARMAAQEYFDNVAARFIEGFITDEKIGDQIWHTSYDRERLSIFALVRKNVFMQIGVARYDDTVKLIKSIDEALVNGSSFVKLSNHIDCPQIISVDVLDPPLVTNEKEYLEVNAYDPLGRELHYQILDLPVDVGKSPSGNVFYARVPEAGEETFSAWVVNDNNVYSYKHIFTLTF